MNEKTSTRSGLLDPVYNSSSPGCSALQGMCTQQVLPSMEKDEADTSLGTKVIPKRYEWVTKLGQNPLPFRQEDGKRSEQWAKACTRLTQHQTQKRVTSTKGDPSVAVGLWEPDFSTYTFSVLFLNHVKHLKISFNIWYFFPYLETKFWMWGSLKWYVKVLWSEVKSLSYVRLFATPWTVACQAPPSVGFSMQEYWSGLPFSSPKLVVLLL